MWGLGTLIWETFNGPLSSSMNLEQKEKVKKKKIEKLGKNTIIVE